MSLDYASLTGNANQAEGLLKGIAGSKGDGVTQTLGSTVGDIMKPIKEAETIVGAAMLNPEAIMSLISNPQAAIDFVKTYNPITIEVNLMSVLSKNGVSADFFGDYPFLKFLDNSTTHWKSRSPALRGMTPVQRISWYMKAIDEGKFGFDDAVQYCEFCFPLTCDFNHNKHIDNDWPHLPFKIAAAWNNIIFTKVYKSQSTYQWNDGNGHHEMPLSWLSIDITQVADYNDTIKEIRSEALAYKQQKDRDAQLAALMEQQAQDEADAEATAAKNKKNMIIGGVVATVIIIIILIVKQK